MTQGQVLLGVDRRRVGLLFLLARGRGFAVGLTRVYRGPDPETDGGRDENGGDDNRDSSCCLCPFSGKFQSSLLIGGALFLLLNCLGAFFQESVRVFEQPVGQPSANILDLRTVQKCVGAVPLGETALQRLLGSATQHLPFVKPAFHLGDHDFMGQRKGAIVPTAACFEDASLS